MYKWKLVYFIIVKVFAIDDYSQPRDACYILLWAVLTPCLTNYFPENVPVLTI